MVVRGQAGVPLLDSYGPERSAVGDLVLRNATRLTDLATLSNPAAQAARNLALRFLLGLHAVRDRMATQLSEIEIAYADSPLSSGPGSGARWEPEAYCGSPPGAGGEPRFVLYTADAARGRALTRRFADLLEPAPRTPPDATALFVVRPDGYVGLSAKAHAGGVVEQYLQRLAR